jgi:predicted HicB family RNase H-like nuclease
LVSKGAAKAVEVVQADPKGRRDTPLNFRVSPEFRRAFRTFAAQNDMKLNELLIAAFEEYASRHGGQG